MAENSVSIAARRLRRVRRLAQRAKGGQLASLWNVGYPVSAPAVLAGFLAVALVVALWRSSVPAAVEEPAVVETVTYAAEDLRPPLAPPAKPTFPEPARHVVGEGDTLLAIGYELDSTSELITVANSLGGDQLLSIGQELVVPPAASVLESVDPGAALGDIAEANSIPLEVVAVYNSMSVDLRDEPVDRPVVVLPPPIESPTASDSAAAAEGGSEMTIYTIAEGDTILSIAEHLGVDPESIVAANRLGGSTLIVAGNSLEIPMWSRPAEGQEAAEGPRGPFVYEISPGDTLQALASRFGVDVDTIKNNNGVTNPDVIRPGDQIMILPVSGLLYQVEQGDTLSSIAQKFQVDMGPIIDFNYLEDVDSISVGTELILPGANPLPPPPPAAPTLPTTYQVAPGDTVSTIAARFGVDPADIVAANGLSSANMIAVGDSLKITPGAAAARPAPAPTAAPAPRTQPQQQTVTRNVPVPAPAPPPASRPSNPGGGGSIVSIAMEFRGTPYVWGGTTPSGFDCSGFVFYVMQRAGISVSRGMWGQYNAGSHPGRGALQPGDLVFFENTYMPGLSHNGIYIGGDQFIHAADPSTGVTVSSLSSSYWASRWFGATRAW